MSRRRVWLVAVGALVVAGVVVAVSIPDAAPPSRFWANDFDYERRIRPVVGGAPIDGWSLVCGMGSARSDADVRYDGIIADRPAFAWFRDRLGLPIGFRIAYRVRVVARNDDGWTELELAPQSAPSDVWLK